MSYTYDGYYARAATMVDGIGTTSYTYKSASTNGATQVATVDGRLSNEAIAYRYDKLGGAIQRTLTAQQTRSTGALMRSGALHQKKTCWVSSFAPTTVSLIDWPSDGSLSRKTWSQCDSRFKVAYLHVPQAPGARLIVAVRVIVSVDSGMPVCHTKSLTKTSNRATPDEKSHRSDGLITGPGGPCNARLFTGFSIRQLKSRPFLNGITTNVQLIAPVAGAIHGSFWIAIVIPSENEGEVGVPLPCLHEMRQSSIAKVIAADPNRGMPILMPLLVSADRIPRCKTIEAPDGLGEGAERCRIV